MSDERKNAFRRVLYAAMLDFRSHSPVGPQTRSLWLAPWRIGQTFRRLREIQETADWLHNLAFFASHDFEGFEESRFWRHTNSIRQHFPHLERRLGLLYSFFERDWVDGKWVQVRRWGETAEL